MPVYLTCLSVEIAESTPVRGMDWIAVDLTRSEGEYMLLLNGQRKNMTLPRGIEPDRNVAPWFPLPESKTFESGSLLDARRSKPRYSA